MAQHKVDLHRIVFLSSFVNCVILSFHITKSNPTGVRYFTTICQGGD